MSEQQEEEKKVLVKGKKTVWYKPGDIVPANARFLQKDKVLEGVEVRGLHENGGRIVEIHSYLIMNLFEVDIEEDVWAGEKNLTRPSQKNNELFDKTKE